MPLPPEEYCRQCRVRVARYDGDHCSQECAQARAESDLLFEARLLAHAATMRSPDDPVASLAWVVYHWRSIPDDHERRLRDLAASLIESECSEAELTVWRILRSDASVASLATALAVKDRHARNLHTGLRLSA